jgi:hypothetical protein
MYDLSDTINGDSSLKRAEDLISAELIKMTGYKGNMRDMVNNPDLVGSWHKYLTDTVSPFGGVVLSRIDGVPQKMLVMDNLGFSVMNSLFDEHEVKYIFALEVASDKPLIYAKDNHIVNAWAERDIVGEYGMGLCDSENGSLLKSIFKPLLEEVYLFNLLRLENIIKKVN